MTTSTDPAKPHLPRTSTVTSTTSFSSSITTTTTSIPPHLTLDARVLLADNRRAVVRFLGATSFASGSWVGVEFAEPIGKNDGSVQGVRYFECDEKRGMFVRAGGLRVDGGGGDDDDARERAAEDENVKKRDGGKIKGTVAAPFNTSGKRRERVNDGGTIAGVGQSSGAGSRATSVASSVTSLSSGFRSSDMARMSGISGVRNARSVSQSPSLGDVSTRSGLGSARGSRSGSMVGSEVDPHGEDEDEGEETLKPGDDARPPSVTSTRDDSMSQTSSVAYDTASETGNSQRQALSRQPTGATHPARMGLRVSKTQIQDMESKIKALERKRLEDRDKLKKLAQLTTEKDRLESIIQKLQAKFQPQQVELVTLRKQLSRNVDIDTIQADHDAALEMATLDREIAEQTAEELRGELDSLKQKAEELQLDVEILREENRELGRDVTAEEKSGQGWKQLEKSNERLRDALGRLREITQVQEAELRAQVTGLEKDLRAMGDVKGQYEAAKEKLRLADEVIADLRAQLEVATGTDELLERLTEENLDLREQVGDMRIDLEELENLKELNDELEQNHVAAEKQLQEELDFQSGVLGEQARYASKQETKLVEYEQTIAKFRGLVAGLQKHIDDLRAREEITEAEAEELNIRSVAMADVNLKLQISMVKAQVGHIELELERAAAQEAIEHLQIIDLFLVDATRTDRNCILAYFRFKQIAFRASLLRNALSEQLAESNTGTDPFAICDVLQKLMWLSAMCERITSAISNGSLEAFGLYEGASRDLEPVSRNLDDHIAALRTGELRDNTLAEDFQRSNAVITHLAEIHLIDKSPINSMDDRLLDATLVHGYCQVLTKVLSRIRRLVNSFTKTHVVKLNESHETTELLEKCFYQSRSLPIAANKVIRGVQDLKDRSMSLSDSTRQPFQICEQLALECVTFVQDLGRHIQQALHDIIDTTDLTTHTPSSIISTSPATSTALQTVHASLQKLSTQITTLQTHTTTLSSTTEYTKPTPPWTILALQHHAAKSNVEATAQELSTLRNTLNTQTTTLLQRTQTLEEQALKIEFLEARMQDVTSKVARIAELEGSLAEGRVREEELRSTLAERARDIERLRADRDELSHAAGETSHAAVGEEDEEQRRRVRGTSSLSGSTAREIVDMKVEIASLQSAVRFLRGEKRWGVPGLIANSDSNTNAIVGGARGDWSWLLDEPLSRRSRHHTHALPSLVNETKKNQNGHRLRDVTGVFDALLDLTMTAVTEEGCVVDLRDTLLSSISTKATENNDGERDGKKANVARSAWRPFKQQTAWQVARRVEVWEGWVARRDGMLKRGF